MIHKRKHLEIMSAPELRQGVMIGLRYARMEIRGKVFFGKKNITWIPDIISEI